MNCPDCQDEMRPIKLIDSGHAHTERQLGYAAGDAKPGWFFGRFEEQGKVGARMCPQCGRIVLFAEPKSES